MRLFAAIALFALYGILPAYSAVPSTCNVAKSSDTGIELEFNLGTIEAGNVQTDQGMFSALSIPDGYLSRDVGSPALPTCRYLLSMPYGAIPSVKVVDLVQEEVPLADLGAEHPVCPAQPSYSKSAKPEEIYFRINPADYKRASYNTDAIAMVEKRGTARGVGVGALVLSPVQYNPSTKMLRITRKCRVIIEFLNSNKSAADIRTKEYSPVFNKAFDTFLNSPEITTDTTTSKAWSGHPDLVAYPLTYLIVASDQLQGNAKLAEFIEWKKQKGYTVIDHYVSSTATITDVDTWIEAQYAALPVKPSFLLIVGDESGTYCVPAEVNPAIGSIDASWYVTRSDLLYGVIGAVSAGNHIPSIHVGRFSVRSTAELDAQVNKTIWYEKGQFEVPTPDLAYLMKPLGAAGADVTYAIPYGNPQIRYGWYHYFNAANGMTNAVYYLDPTAGASDAAIISHCSGGVNFYNYTAHGNETSFGDPTFSIANVNSLTNLNHYPLVVGNCCLTASFGTTECFGEAWLNRANGGAIGYIGASMSTSWGEDLAMGAGTASIKDNINPPLSQNLPGMYDGRMMEEYPSQGATRFCGLLAVENYGGYCKQYWSAYHLLGDPSLNVYFGIPPAMTVGHLPIISPGATNFSVSVPGVAGALCALYDSATKTLHGAAVTDGSGNATIALKQAGPATGNLNLTVTDVQKRPYIATVQVVGSLFNFQQTTVEVNENAGTLNIYVTRLGSGADAASVDYVCSNVTAAAGSDYTATAGRLDFAAGIMTNVIAVPIINDTTDESSEKFRVYISNPLPSGMAVVGVSPMCEVTIMDDEGAGELCLAQGPVTVSESSAPAYAQVAVRRINGSVGAVSAQFVTANGTATVAGGDYVQTNGTVNLGDGVTNATIQIMILADLADEADESLSVSLRNAVGASIVAPTSTVVTILDDDVGGALAFAPASYSVRNAAQTVPVTVQRSVGSDGAVSVSYATVAGTASAGSDYTTASGTLLFADGQTTAQLDVQVLNASLSKPAENFYVVLSNPSGGAILGTSTSAVVNINAPTTVCYEPMNVNPGWTCQGLWAFGQPTGQASDPASGYNAGLNVYGYNLNGAYEDGLAATYLTTPAFDCSSYTNVYLSFYRWLGVETSAYDHACVQVSTNGTAWMTVWTNSATMTDSSWTLVNYNISSIADRKPSVRVRWVMGDTDSSLTYCGWNIDDVAITGKCVTTAHSTPYTWLTSYGLTNNYELADITDQDGDGLLAWQEYIAGTDPTNAGSVFMVLGMGSMGSSNSITWYGTTNSGVTNSFIMLRATNLFNSVWQPVGTNSRSPTGVNIWWDRNPPSNVPVFYRPTVQ